MKQNIQLGVLSLSLLLTLLGCASLITPRVTSEVASLKAGDYKLDRAHATVLFKVSHLGLSTYVGRFNEFDASLDFAPENIAATKLNGIIDIDSLDINNVPLAKDLLGRSWFDQERFPQAVFTTREVREVNANQFEFVGDLDWRGVVKPIALLVTFNGGANNILSGRYTLGFEAEGTFLRSDFGMDAYIPAVGDEIKVEIYAEFQRS